MHDLSVLIRICLWVAITPGLGFGSGFNTEMTNYVHGLETQAKSQEPGFKGFDQARGKKLFFDARPNDKSGTISCGTCHTADLKQSGRTLVGKSLDPLAPSVNKNRLTNAQDVDKWLTRNFKQVYGREGTAKEKGDVLTYIDSQ